MQQKLLRGVMKYFGMWDLREMRFHKKSFKLERMVPNLSAYFCTRNMFSLLQAFVARALLVVYARNQTILSASLRGTFALDKAYRKRRPVKNSLKLEFCVGEGLNAV